LVSGRGGKITAEQVEVESGKRKRKGRPILDQAIAEAQATGVTVLVAKIDRLSRDVEFLFNLRNSRIDFAARDLPDFSTLSLGIFFTIAQQEREHLTPDTRCSRRTSCA
jgi:DNA invertase Pin-like site-specific DNA recombinase